MPKNGTKGPVLIALFVLENLDITRKKILIEIIESNKKNSFFSHKIINSNVQLVVMVNLLLT